MDAKTYLRDEYWKYWIDARQTTHRASRYDENLCEYVRRLVPPGSRVLEVAIGTGEPFAAYFASQGFAVEGVDISPQLVAHCQVTHPQIACQVGDAEHLPYPDGRFDAAYCFHSSWIFPNIKRAIDEMLRVTRSKGWVIFDAQNRNNARIASEHRRHIRETKGIWKLLRLGRQVAKLLLRRGHPNWYSVPHLWPSDPDELRAHLTHSGVSELRVFGRAPDDSLVDLTPPGSFPEYGRLGFVVFKT